MNALRAFTDRIMARFENVASGRHECVRLAFLIAAMGLALTVPCDARDVWESRVFTTLDTYALPYRLLKPRHYKPARPWPLVLFLHGAGERGNDNQKQLSPGLRNLFISKEAQGQWPCFVVAPQCPDGQRWVNVDFGATSHVIPDEPSASMTSVLALLTALQAEFSIDRSRLYVMGLSMGGYGTWDILARRPQLFAAGLPICGGADLNTAPTIASVPLWIFHGSEDTVVPVSRSRDMVSALGRAGGSPVYTEYKGVGHDAWSGAFAEPNLLHWLFSHCRKP